MLYLYHTPPPPLSYFVDCLWLYSDTPAHVKERIVPSGTIELVVNLCDDELRIDEPGQSERCRRFPGAVVSGAYGRFFVIDARQQASLLGVHFRPGGAFPFVGVPAGELFDRHVDLETLWGPGAVELRERLCAAATDGERFRLMEEALMARLSGAPARHPAVPTALEAFGRTGPGPSVREVARRVGLSERRFIQVFTAEVGQTPKLFHRVRRFQRVLDRVRGTAAPDWARLAVACGYYDQSHLIRDFRAFSGLSPTDYLGQRSERVKENHVPMVQGLPPPRRS